MTKTRTIIALGITALLSFTMSNAAFDGFIPVDMPVAFIPADQYPIGSTIPTQEVEQTVSDAQAYFNTLIEMGCTPGVYLNEGDVTDANTFVASLVGEPIDGIYGVIYITPDDTCRVAGTPIYVGAYGFNSEYLGSQSFDEAAVVAAEAAVEASHVPADGENA